MQSKVVSMNIAAKPKTNNVFRPALSTINTEIIVMATFTIPIIIVPISAAASPNWAPSLKIDVE